MNLRTICRICLLGITLICGTIYAQDKKDSFRMAAVGDIQVGDLEEIGYANQTILPELLQLKNIDLALFLGDLVNDEPSLFPYIKEMTDRLPFPSRFLFGNHDRDLGVAGIQDSVFRQYLGPSFYSFDYKQVHFIILNNIYPQGKRGYEARFSEEQLRFAESDLKKVPANKLLVICQHIPLAYTKNKEDLIRLLAGRKQILALSGHTHQVSRNFIREEGVFIHELVAGTSCGNWWVGEKDWQGIPAALMQCGSPRNYFLIDFTKTKYQIRFKGVGLDADRQMDIWVSGQDTLDNYIGLSADTNNKIIANIYGGSDSTLVKIQVDNDPWVEMQQEAIVAPNVSRVTALNKADIYPTRYNRKGALRNTPSPHIWSTLLPDKLSPGIHTIRISAKDNFGFEVTGSRMITIPFPSPS